jgi:hypothetical protein
MLSAKMPISMHCKSLACYNGARSSSTPFKQDPRPLLKLHGISSRIDYAWVAPVGNWRELVAPEEAHPVSGEDLGLAIERQVVVVLRHHDMGQQTRPGSPAGDRVVWRRRRHHHFANPARRSPEFSRLLSAI